MGYCGKYQGDLHEFPTQPEGMYDQRMIDAIGADTENIREHVVERAATSIRLRIRSLDDWSGRSRC